MLTTQLKINAAVQKNPRRPNIHPPEYAKGDGIGGWPARSTVREALHFVQGHLGRQPAAYPAQKLMAIEIAATSGMLSALDRRSRLIDAETYRIVRATLRNRTDLTRADAGAIDPAESTNTSGTVAAATSAVVPPDDEPLGLLLTTGRLLAAGGAEIEGRGVQPDIDQASPAGEQPRAAEDCLLQLAQDVAVQAQDAQRPTLLSTAKALDGPTVRPPTAPPRP
jgi:hypothetical protein